MKTDIFFDYIFGMRSEKGQMRKLISFFKDEEGATAVEYSLIVALIAALIILTVVFLGKQVEKSFNIIW